jgi:hypothetical protein
MEFFCRLCENCNTFAINLLNDLQSIAEALLNTVARFSSTQNGRFKIKGVPALYFDKISEKTGDYYAIRYIKKQKTCYPSSLPLIIRRYLLSLKIKDTLFKSSLASD